MRLLILLLAVSTGVLVSLKAAPLTTVVSGPSVTGATATGNSSQPAISPDGRYVTFSSDAGDMTPATGLLPYFNVYLRDRELGEVSLISINMLGTGGNGHSVGGSVSDDGRFIAFQSDAGNLGSNDTNGTSDVFLRDRVAGTTVLVSRERSGWTGWDRHSIVPLLSGDGRRVVFESDAADLVANDTNGAPDIFVYDRLTDSNSLVSANADNTGSRAGASGSATMTPDGQWVAFVNWVTNQPSPALPVSQIYLRGLNGIPDSPIHWVSASVSSTLVDFAGVFQPASSSDGRVVFFSLTTTSLPISIASNFPAASPHWWPRWSRVGQLLPLVATAASSPTKVPGWFAFGIPNLPCQPWPASHYPASRPPELNSQSPSSPTMEPRSPS